MDKAPPGWWRGCIVRPSAVDALAILAAAKAKWNRECLSAAQAEADERVKAAVEAERERIADWYEDEGWLLDEGHVADAIRAGKEVSHDA